MDLYQIFITHNRSWTIRESFFCHFIFNCSHVCLEDDSEKQNYAVTGSCRYGFIIVPWNCIWFNRIYAYSHRAALQIGIVLVMESGF